MNGYHQSSRVRTTVIKVCGGIGTTGIGMRCDRTFVRANFKTDLEAGSFDFLAERWVRIEVTDLGLKFCISVQSESQRMRFQVTPECVQPAVFMRVDWSALLQLSTQQVDPDTLFFRRKLLLTGDTELGLQVKNLLDTIELEQRLPRHLYQQLAKFAEATAQASEKQNATAKSLTWIK